ncbi:TMEM175 family protein [Fimbriiglobus ruber]|uniref:Integral membrane protein n=1 Tax=Fimbriiglobus ruber TaxID=1908690 RepID=A0A225E7N1_9BACT|nr:TMEM175 family protein [Fimbriiglobus ruber]OWK44437.1 Integral membrane protein [Fimbriiglobus ruber]
MGKNRLEAFSDGVIAIIITIMVLEMKAPSTADLDALEPLLPAFLSYVLSFIYVGIYWNNHHHVFHAVQRVSGTTLWANLHLLFWLSLIPFVTRWVGESHFATIPVVAYGLVLLLCAIAWEIERRVLLRCHDTDSPLTKAMSDNRKEWVSAGLYALALGLAFVHTWIAFALYCVVALIWVIPDRRIEREIGSAKE